MCLLANKMKNSTRSSHPWQWALRLSFPGSNANSMVTCDMVIIYHLPEYDASFSRSYLLNLIDKRRNYTHAKHIKLAKKYFYPISISHNKTTINNYLPHMALNNLQ